MQLARPSAWRIAIFATLVAVVSLSPGCGEDDSSSSGDQNQRAFLEAMVPHHRSAIAMARVAQERGNHPEVRELASAIVSAQEREIGQMRRIYRRAFGETLRANMDARAQLGLSADDAGMMMHDDREAVGALRNAKPFDRAFIDAMIPHHQGAIRMARVILTRGGDTRILDLADAIIRAQAQEIRNMNDWRREWHGAASPAGGVPKEGSMGGSMDSSMDGSGGEHEGQ